METTAPDPECTEGRDEPCRRTIVLERGTHFHLVGIGGSGMSGIAEVLVNLGYQVSGSDLARSPITDRLQALGVRFDEGHDAGYVHDADAVVVSTAVPSDNPEREAAALAGIPVITRGVMLAELAGLKRGVAVVGSHGKTTTTAMIALVLEAAGLDPTAIIGGRLSAFGSNARLGQGPFMVVEADESDGSFLRLSPEIAVLTNIDEEHLDAYDGMEDLENSFVSFAERVSADGCVVACLDDQRLRRLLPRVHGQVVTYGIENRSAHCLARDVTLGPLGSRCRVQIAVGRSRTEVDLQLGVPGRHNLQNALAALSVGVRLDLAPEATAEALALFRGADRRFQVHGEVAGVVVVDDYAHHPTEIQAALDTARLRAPARLRVVFQPHRYSRTIRLLERFGEALAAADEVILTEVYAASEPPIPGATSVAVAEAIKRVSSVPVRLVDSLDQIPALVAADSRSGDLVITLGAGSIGTVAPRIIEALRRDARAGDDRWSEGAAR